MSKGRFNYKGELGVAHPVEWGWEFLVQPHCCTHWSRRLKGVFPVPVRYGPELGLANQWEYDSWLSFVGQLVGNLFGPGVDLWGWDVGAGHQGEQGGTGGRLGTAGLFNSGPEALWTAFRLWGFKVPDFWRCWGCTDRIWLSRFSLSVLLLFARKANIVALLSHKGISIKPFLLNF